MFLTARQLDDLHRTSGATGIVVLPYSAKLTPLARDWLRSKKVTVGYADVNVLAQGDAKTQAISSGAAVGIVPVLMTSSLPILWWCDGPCGVAKAALMSVAREALLKELVVLEDATRVLPAVRHLAIEVKAGRAAGGVLVVKSAGPACVFANRTSSLRAVVGTSLANVEDAVKTVFANVLILEQDKLTLNVARNLMSRFVRSIRPVDEAVSRALSDLAKL